MQVGKNPGSTAKLIKAIEESKVPLGEEEPKFHAIKEKHAKGKPLTGEEQNLVMKLSRKAREWEKDVEESSDTQPEDTLAG